MTSRGSDGRAAAKAGTSERVSGTPGTTTEWTVRCPRDRLLYTVVTTDVEGEPMRTWEPDRCPGCGGFWENHTALLEASA